MIYHTNTAHLFKLLNIFTGDFKKGLRKKEPKKETKEIVRKIKKTLRVRTDFIYKLLTLV